VVKDSTNLEKDLFELYKIAMDEYRYEVNLGWEAVKFFTTLHVGIISFGITILGLTDITLKLIVIPIFIIGIFLSNLGYNTRIRYRQYYLRSLYDKTLIEDQLKLRQPLRGYSFENHILAISPTETIDNPEESLIDPNKWIDKYMKPKGTVTYNHLIIFRMLRIIYIIMILGVTILYVFNYLFFK
jgi:hypothetical protein